VSVSAATLKHILNIHNSILTWFSAQLFVASQLGVAAVANIYVLYIYSCNLFAATVAVATCLLRLGRRVSYFLFGALLMSKSRNAGHRNR